MEIVCEVCGVTEEMDESAAAQMQGQPMLHVCADCQKDRRAVWSQGDGRD